MKKRNCIIGQSGGPTAAINASLAGVIYGAKYSNEYENVYGMIHGIMGLLENRYIDPVSYTHLDVYKRQIIFRSIINSH